MLLDGTVRTVRYRYGMLYFLKKFYYPQEQVLRGSKIDEEEYEEAFI